MGLSERWSEIKLKYAEANKILGDIPKVTPSSKVVGDLAQFMVAQNLDAKSVVDQAETLAFPDSVVSYMRGEIGIPPGGFPEPLRSKVLSSRNLGGVEGRPGATLDSYNFEVAREFLTKRYGAHNINDKELLSYALYPDVYTQYKDFEATYGEVSKLPTHLFLNPMKIGDEVELELDFGKTLLIKLISIQDMRADGTRIVLFEVNGETWYMPVSDLSSKGERKVREKATKPPQVGAPMPGVVVSLKVKAGDTVQEGEPVATLSAMKMETSIPATASGKVSRVIVNVGDKVEGDDLILEIE